MSGWNCRPPAAYGALDRTGYLAGYSDGFHGYHFGSGYVDPPPGYRVGFEQGCADRRPVNQERIPA
jgi:hypothetical protein